MAIETSTTVAERILAIIRTRGLQAGDPMPTELDLIGEIGVSRNTVREAIRELRALGIVDVRHGYGTFVAEASLRALTPSLVFRAIVAGPQGLKALRNLAEIRELIEAGTVPTLCGTLAEAKKTRLYGLCDLMEDPAQMEAADREFHRVMYEDIDNPLVGQLVDVFWDAYHDAHHQLTESGKRTVVATAQAHRDIVQAIESGDKAGAEHAMHEHFDGIYTRLSDLGAEI